MEVLMDGLLVGKKAPYFQEKAVADRRVIENFSLDLFSGKYVILFFYPLNFTFVCPTELHAFQEKLNQFKERQAEIIGCSVDSHFSHLKWLSTPKEEGGIEGVTYPIISDIKKRVSRSYAILNELEGISFRALFLIDPRGVVRHQLINDFPLGRSVEEALRMLDALIFHEKHGDVCPANWKEGEKSMKPTQEGLVNYFR